MEEIVNGRVKWLLAIYGFRKSELFSFFFISRRLIFRACVAEFMIYRHIGERQGIGLQGEFVVVEILQVETDDAYR